MSQVSTFSLGREAAGDGSFKRQESAFRQWVTAGGSSGFPAEAGRATTSTSPGPVPGRTPSETYQATRPGFEELVSVPVLWDRETGCIVNNESGEIVRMLAWERNAVGPQLSSSE